MGSGGGREGRGGEGRDGGTSCRVGGYSIIH